MIRAREVKNDVLITLKCIPVSMIIVFFYGCQLGPHTHPWLERVALALRSVFLTTSSHFIEERSRLT